VKLAAAAFAAEYAPTCVSGVRSPMEAMFSTQPDPRSTIPRVNTLVVSTVPRKLQKKAISYQSAGAVSSFRMVGNVAPST
jgi:hypothetical protein